MVKITKMKRKIALSTIIIFFLMCLLVWGDSGSEGNPMLLGKVGSPTNITNKPGMTVSFGPGNSYPCPKPTEGEFKFVLRLDESEVRQDWKITIGSPEGRSILLKKDFRPTKGETWLTPTFRAAECQITMSQRAPWLFLEASMVTDPDRRTLSVVCENPRDCSDEKANFNSVSDYELGSDIYAPAPILIKSKVKGMVFLVVEDWDEEKIYTCSGFFVSNLHIMTNWHCLYGKNPDEGKKAGRARVWARAITKDPKTSPTIQNAVLRFPKSFASAGKIDVAILEINNSFPDVLPFRVDFNEMGSEPFAILQYPKNYPLVINADAQCKGYGMGTIFQSDSSGNRVGSVKYLKHGCDTMGGSSGSPLLHRDLKSVVALHYFGHKPGQYDLNRAFLMKDVLEELKKKAPDLFNAIIRQSP